MKPPVGETLPRRYASSNIAITTEDFSATATDTTAHRLEVIVMDSSGKVLIAAPPVKFYVHRATVGRSRR